MATRGALSRGAGLALAVALGGAALAGCGEPNPDRMPGPALLEEVEVEVVATITVDESGFHGDGITIEPGEAVELVNDGDDEHSFTASEHFDTGLLLPGERTVLRLLEPDTYRFVDRSDPDNEGLLVVAEPPED